MQLLCFVLILTSLIGWTIAVPTLNTHKAASPFCDASAVVPDLPSNGNLSVPPGQSTVAVALARGLKNYTCSFSTIISTGALALLYDITCLASSLAPTAMNGTTGFNLSLLPPLALQSPFDPFLPYPFCNTSCNSTNSSTIPLDLVGQHYYIPVANATSNGTAILPFFTLPGYGNVTGTTNGTAPAPQRNGSYVNVDWEEWVAIQGGVGMFARTVFQTDTAGGGWKGLTNCSSNGNMTTVNYAALYYFLR
ncbi:hypothetical protein JCM1840_003598 [Sporobolomyces johnsonii]